MKAINISVAEFIDVLNKMRQSGYELIDLDITPDENQQTRNKLVVYPVAGNDEKMLNQGPPIKNTEGNGVEIRNPNIDKNNNDIFGSFNKFI